MDRPKITIITPVYNNPDLLDTVRSIMAQDYPHIQYIVIDDGSESFDGDAVLAQSKVNPSVELRVMMNGENIGTVRTLNRAIRESDGKYIFSIAADDRLHDEHVLSDWVAEFESSGAMVVMGMRDVYDERMEVRLRSSPSKKVRKKIRGSSPKELFRSMYGSNMIVGCCTAQSRECFDRFGLYDERYRIIEDYPRYLYLSREGVHIHLFDRTVVDYRMGGVSSQGRFNDVYEKESDAIFRNEVEPFAEDKDEARRMYQTWKDRTAKKHAFLERYIQSKRFTGRWAAWIGYALRDPMWAAQFFLDFVKLRLG